MKNIFSKILISFFSLVFFLTPVSVGLINHAETGERTAIITINQVEAYWPGSSAQGIWDALVAVWDYGLDYVANLVLKVINFLLDLIFRLLALLAAATADILDFFIFYSIGSSAYKSTFIEAAWGTVRDVANIFFLLGLLYVALQIILGSHVSEAKGMIGKIIIMALLVNFSLFATQVVIDTSNIVAKVFYNQIEAVDSTGKPLPDGKNVPKSVTVKIVEVFKPQDLVSQKTSTSQQTFSLLILIALMAYLCYLFISVSLLFVGRIVSLWVAMIFSPIAFMTRAIGIKIPDLSWGEWLKNLTSSALMAPIFIFFLYIILLLGGWLKVLQNDILVLNGQGSPFLAFLNTIIPFAIIFTLLTKAKGLAVKYSGEMGQMVSKVGFAAAGVALGGAALGGAALSRNTIGALAKYSKDDEKRGKDKNIKENIQTQWNAGGLQRWNLIKYAKTAGKGVTANLAEKITTTSRNTSGEVTGRTGFGNFVQNAKHEFHEKKEAQSTIQSKISKMSEKLHIDKDAKFDSLGKDKQEQIIESINMDMVSKKMYKNRSFDELSQAEKRTVRNTTITENTDGSINFTGVDINGVAKSGTNVEGAREVAKIARRGTTGYTIAGEAIDSASKGSWDIRNISKTSSKELKTMVALLAGIAMILRGGLKKVDIDPGTGQKDFLNDISKVITSAIKSSGMGSGGGGGHKKDDHGGGDHGHGGGGHH